MLIWNQNQLELDGNERTTHHLEVVEKPEGKANAGTANFGAATFHLSGFVLLRHTNTKLVDIGMKVSYAGRTFVI